MGRLGSGRCSAKWYWGRRSRPRPSSRPSLRRPSRTSSEGAAVCGASPAKKDRTVRGQALAFWSREACERERVFHICSEEKKKKKKKIPPLIPPLKKKKKKKKKKS